MRYEETFPLYLPFLINSVYIYMYIHIKREGEKIE